MEKTAFLSRYRRGLGNRRSILLSYGRNGLAETAVQPEQSLGERFLYCKQIQFEVG